MDKHIKIFNTHSEYEAFASTDGGIFIAVPDGDVPIVRNESEDIDYNGEHYYAYDAPEEIIYFKVLFEEDGLFENQTFYSWNGSGFEEVGELPIRVVNDGYTEPHVSYCREEVPADGRKYCVQYNSSSKRMLTVMSDLYHYSKVRFAVDGREYKVSLGDSVTVPFGKTLTLFNACIEVRDYVKQAYIGETSADVPKDFTLEYDVKVIMLSDAPQ